MYYFYMYSFSRYLSFKSEVFTMKEFRPELLRESLERVLEREEAFTLRFYEILFERFPQALPLFGRKSQQAQAEMLQEAIIAVVEHVEDGVWMSETLETMGRIHVDYQVTEEMYPWVGECLIATLKEISGPDWSEAVEASWGHAYAVISGAMIEGARKRLEEEGLTEPEVIGQGV